MCRNLLAAVLGPRAVATGTPLELAAKKYAESWNGLGGKPSRREPAKEFAQRHFDVSLATLSVVILCPDATRVAPDFFLPAGGSAGRDAGRCC